MGLFGIFSLILVNWIAFKVYDVIRRSQSIPALISIPGMVTAVLGAALFHLYLFADLVSMSAGGISSTPPRVPFSSVAMFLCSSASWFAFTCLLERLFSKSNRDCATR